MALVRCPTHGNPQGRAGNDYVANAQPVGYPETAAICGRPECNSPGLVWLTREEQIAYARGQRNFALSTNAAKIKVQ